MIRDVAEWFHEREGEMFTPGDAASRLSRELDITKGEARDCIRGLLGDLVDPVEQVMVEGDKYVGVIEYEEHGFWYEYIHYHDTRGKLRRGVCAQCVQEADRDTEVYHATQGMGSVPRDASEKVLEEKIQEHYGNRHDVKPADVETGATLLSGTTVGGNLVIHAGNDGPGSTVDADIFDGLEKSSYIEVNKTYPKNNRKIPYGEIVRSFSAPGSDPRGVAIDNGDGCVWVTDNSAGSVYKLDRDGNLQNEAEAPGSSPEGLDFGSDNSIYIGDSSGNTIYEVFPNIVLQVQNQVTPSVTPSFIEGVDIDHGSGCIWYTDLDGGPTVREMDRSGNVTDSFTVSDMDIHGLGIDQETGCIWVSEATEEELIRLDRDGSIASRFSVTATATEGVGVGPDGCVWHTDTDSMIYRFDQSGNLQSTIQISFNGAGMEIDSSGCIWVADWNFPYPIHRMKPEGVVESTLYAPSWGNYGFGVDSDSCLWTTYTGSHIIKAQSGKNKFNVPDSFSAQGSTVRGVGLDSNDCIWHADPSTGTIYSADEDGFDEDSINSAPSLSSITGLTLDSNDSIWYNVAATKNRSRKIDQTGSVIEVFSNPSIDDIAGVTHDDARTLWVVDSSSGSIFRLGLDNNAVTFESPDVSPGEQ